VQHIDMVVSAASSALIDANAVETQVCLGPRGGPIPRRARPHHPCHGGSPFVLVPCGGRV